MQTGFVWRGSLLLVALAAADIVVPLVGRAETNDLADSSLATREQMYQDVSEEADALIRQGSLLKKVVRLVTPTVVHIEARHANLDGKTQRPVEEAGSGVIIRWNNRFYILTNRHVIKKSTLDTIRIKLADGRHLHPTKVWEDRETDIALLAVNGKGLFAARLGDSGKVEMGDFVLAMGSPFGLSHSCSYGIISAKGRRDLQLGDDGVRYQDFLQTDAAINPGNSGGPLINLRGEVIGVNTAIASNSGVHEGIGFSIPINMAMTVAKQLIEHGSVVRAYLGVKLDAKFGGEDAMKMGLEKAGGARVTAITPNSPAAAGEIQVGDVILEFDGVAIEDDGHLINLVSLTQVGKEVSLQLFREGASQAIKVKVGNRNEIEP